MFKIGQKLVTPEGSAVEVRGIVCDGERVYRNSVAATFRRYQGRGK